MPELRLREVRLPELSLPEMSRDDIVRAISDARRDIDLPDVELPKVELPKVDLTRIDLSKVDVAKAVTTAAQAAGFVRRARPRWPFLVAGAIAVAAVGFALMTSPAVKPRLTEAARRWRERLAARRAEAMADIDQPAAPIAIPVEPTAFDDLETTAPTPVADEVAPV